MLLNKTLNDLSGTCGVQRENYMADSYIGRRFDAEVVKEMLSEIVNTDGSIKISAGFSDFSKREIFTLVAMHALRSNPNFSTTKNDKIAEFAINQADNIIAQLTPPTPKKEAPRHLQESMTAEDAIKYFKSIDNQNNELQNILNGMNGDLNKILGIK